MLETKRQIGIKEPYRENSLYAPLNFTEIDSKAKNLAKLIEKKNNKLIDILLKYESYEVAQDEIGRTLDLLNNLEENREYFQIRVGEVASFLPRNQPLYAFSCFVLVPSLMASKVHFRIPQSMRGFFQEMMDCLEIEKKFPNIKIFNGTRVEFLKERSALYVNTETKDKKPITDVVIFTGTPIHADHLKLVFDKKTLFITNGAGHNPVIISKNADIKDACEAVVKLQFYNQGQDCAAPNSILVHKSIIKKVLKEIHKKIKETKIGHYKDKSCRIGPISDLNDLPRIEEILVKNNEWIDPQTPGIINTKEGVVEPTVICKPLIEGGNYNESFAPIIFIQEYKNDDQLKLYFENKHYIQNAMYITLYGKSKYISSIIGKPIMGKVLHPKESIIINNHLHAPGVERGTQPYGGYGYGASNISIDGETINIPTLPQRDIYEYIARPIMENGLHNTEIKYDSIQKKNVEKILKLELPKKEENGLTQNGEIYIDKNLIKDNDSRYVKIKISETYRLFKKPNSKYIASLDPETISFIHRLKKLLISKKYTDFENFCTELYKIPKKASELDYHHKLRQFYFFQQIYQLLFGKKFGPKLTEFLWNVNNNDIIKLLDV